MLEVILNSSWIVLVYVVFWFILATIIKDNGIMDIAWGLGFVILSFFSLFSFGIIGPRPLLITFISTIWGLRLGGHIAVRKRGKPEDFRYAAWRKDWGKWVIPRAFFQVFLLQGFFMLLISLPILTVNR